MGWNYQKGIFISLLLLSLILSFSSCSSFYQKNIEYNNHILNGEIEEAKKVLHNNKKLQKDKNRLLYLMNAGWIEWMLGNNEASNKYLNEADTLIEDMVKNPATEVLSFFINPNVKPYEPEDFEKVFVNYFKALNFLQLEQYNEALIECRRMTNLLYRLNDKYKDRKNRYSDDAFAQLLIGLIYDAAGDYNNAFIAYRNSLQVYDSVYVRNFGTGAPEQLKKDLIRTAYQSGLFSEGKWYEDHFGITYQPQENNAGDLIFIWQNGLGPVKAEWSVNFTQLPGEAGFVNYTNEELGITFPFYIGNKSDKEKDAFSDIKFIRIAFPKYVERLPFYTSGKVVVNDSAYNLSVAQDVNSIAFKTLNDRMMREMGTAVIRLVTKQAMEEITREQNQDAGAVVGIINALTEQADTRNWQSLPYSVSYSRIPLGEGQHDIRLETYNQQTKNQYNFRIEMIKGKTRFIAFQNLD